MTSQELDEAVARKLHPAGSCHCPEQDLECICQEVPPYSTSIEAAWEIVERINYFCLVKPLKDERWKCDLGTGKEIVVQWAETAPLAICKAFLAMEEK